MLKGGDTVFMPKHADATPHLWVILTNPNVDGLIAIVNITSLNTQPDTTTILQVGDHPFIRHASVVLYSDARIAPLLPIEQGIKMNSGLFRQLDPCSDELLKKICNGIFVSDFTPNKVIEFC